MKMFELIKTPKSNYYWLLDNKLTAYKSISVTYDSIDDAVCALLYNKVNWLMLEKRSD